MYNTFSRVLTSSIDGYTGSVPRVSRSSITWFRGPSRKKEGERARRGNRFHRSVPRKEKEKEEKDGIAKEREKAGRFCSTAPDEARVALLLRKRDSRRKNEDITVPTGSSPPSSGVSSLRLWSGWWDDSGDLRLPRMSNSLAMQFLASRWNLHCLGSTTGYNCASGSWPKPKRERASGPMFRWL